MGRLKKAGVCDNGPALVVVGDMAGEPSLDDPNTSLLLSKGLGPGACCGTLEVKASKPKRSSAADFGGTGGCCGAASKGEDDGCTAAIPRQFQPKLECGGGGGAGLTSHRSLLPHAGGNQIGREDIRQWPTGVRMLLYDKVHGDGELISCENTLLVHIGKVPDLSENLLRELGV